ncbi:MAG: sigma-70 family RNA polymerase sigma factor [Chloroflexi bacterium]|nr:sigma-70 family RNA polymerase sigma factor [Chloroflexota bacterium]
MTIDEGILIRRAKGGDTEAFGVLVSAHQQFVYNLILRTLGDPHEAEDLSQEAFVRAWLALPNFRQQSQFRTWLYRIATNLCYNRLPRLRRDMAAVGDEEVMDVAGDESNDPTTRAEAQERQAFLHRQIEALPESYRLLIALRYQQELSYEEIASVVSLPVGTVKTGLFRAKARLRAALKELTEEPA